MAEYKESASLIQLAARVIGKYARFAHLDDPECRIAYQYSDEAKKSGGKVVYADTERVKEKLKGFLPFDFIITFYRPNTEHLDEDRMEKLMFHELCHIGFKGPGSYSIIPHDIEDFRVVIDSWGLDWI